MLGYDLGAALALGSALGVCRVAAAELLPAIERVVVTKMNEQAGTGDEGRSDP
ncbi:DUF7697 family protein [Limimaricola pyoseonensis]|uniref:DUF7697 family protein n=1 Tax=Limimaricola pyoseonensis TaxID=521013 RepID=UPI001F613FFB|nr:hypothetical protein [Limimaricola pyoseonensis]